MSQTTSISISELEAMRAKMTPGEYRQCAFDKYNVFCDCEDALVPVLGRVLFGMNTYYPYEHEAAGLVAEHNAFPALLAIVDSAQRYMALVDQELVVGGSQMDEAHLKAMFAAKDELRAALRKVRP